MTVTAPSRPEQVLVGTKLNVPQVRPGTLARPELVDRLTAGEGRKLTLLCAPAGWGKTFLLTEWHAAGSDSRPFAWVSLDPSDDDPVRFWSYVVGALRGVAPEVGSSALARIPNAGASLTDVVLPGLINELEGMRRPLVLVLDDYHVVHDELIHDSVAYLLRHLPRTVRLAIATRADPPLPLGRLRAAAEVVELRAAELRFSDGEANQLLNDVLDLALGADDVGLLQERTEGWPAGLQLAALSLRERTDRRAFVRAFAGDDRQIGEYLHDVIGGQDRPLREFLLRTSILERLCAPLCDAVTGEHGAAALLSRAYRSNLFLVALDTRGYWYRYHHLFRDLLRNELAVSEPELVAELHRRAHAWHLENGDIEDAIFHASAAGDLDEARELIAHHWLRAWQISRRTVARWLDSLPPEAVRADPRLCIINAYTAAFEGRPDEVEPWLRAAERQEHAGPFPFGSTDANVALVRTATAWVAGDVGRSSELVRVAHVLTEGEPSPVRELANTFLGLTRYFSGDVHGSTEPLEEARRSDSWVGAQALLTALGVLAAARVDLGELDAAEEVVAEVERMVDELGLREAPTSTLPEVARGRLLAARGDVDGADTAFEHAARLARQGGWPLDLAHALIERARLKRRKDFAGARALAREARQVLSSCADPGVLGEQLAKAERSLQLAASRGTQAGPAADPELSERELTVLSLLAGELSQREIGAELFISLNTVKGHVRSIFRKLGVATRADAVARGRELGLL